MTKLAVPVAPLLSRLELDPAATALIAGAADADAALALLIGAGLLQEASRLVAHALPKREAVWWLCMCARSIPSQAPLALDTAALVAAETWVRKPDEAARRAAMQAAHSTAFAGPEAWAAVAAFWSGGSMAPEGQPNVPPGENLTGVAVSGGIVLAAVRDKPERAPDRYLRFLTAARDIAAGGPGRLEPEAP